jgi:polyisoprenoid-binding protein YceI
MKKLNGTVLLCIGLLSTANIFAAKNWQMIKGSNLIFSTRFEGKVVTGRFTRFNADIRFDPKNLAHSRFDVLIDLSSVDSQNIEHDDALKTSDFFDVKQHPNARFTATQFQHLGNATYVATGQLQLHGIRNPANLRFTWQQSKGALLVGEAVIKRLDFHVGIGDWQDTALIPNAVKINTTLVLIPKVPAKP